MTSETNPSRVKAGKGLVKLTTASGVMCGTSMDYERIVNNRRDKEGHLEEFTAAPRAWGEKVDGLIVKKDSQDYVTFYFDDRCTKTSVKFLLDGKEVSKCEIQHLLPKEQDKSSRQELDNPITYRNYKVESITSITVDGVIYT